MGTILLFTDASAEQGRIAAMLKAEGMPVIETSSIFESIHYLKAEDVRMVLATSKLNLTEATEFKALVKSIDPGIGVLFVNTADNGSQKIEMDGEELGRFISRTLHVEQSMQKRMSGLKDFCVSYTDRLMQVFGATGRYIFGRDHLVARLSRRTALQMGLPAEAAETAMIAALLRDLGMLGIEHQLLGEKKSLNARELALVRKHTSNTVHLLKDVTFPWNVDVVILQHHENYDGSGYPGRLKGRQIAVGARIIRIADSFIAMTTPRPHRPAMSHNEATQELIRGTGTKYDPEVIEAFLAVAREDMPHESRRRSVLIIESSPNIAPMVKLSVDLSSVDISSADNGVDAAIAIKKKVPDLIVADVDTLKMNTIIHIFNSMYEVPDLQEAPFIFVIPTPQHPRHFIGEHIRYITKPVDIEELHIAIKTLMANKHELPQQVVASKGIKGSLKDFSLGEIVQILHLGLKTARVEVTHDGMSSVVHLVQGNVVHASNGRLTGKDAFFGMMRWEAGAFCIEHGVAPPGHNINSDTMHLLLEAARLQDEAASR